MLTLACESTVTKASEEARRGVERIIYKAILLHALEPATDGVQLDEEARREIGEP